MGIGGISIWQLLIILVIIILIFGTKKLRSLGGDLGGAVKGFKKAVTDEDAEKIAKTEAESVEGDVDTKKESAEDTAGKTEHK